MRLLSLQNLCLSICQLFFNSCLQKQSPSIFYTGFRERKKDMYHVQNTFKLPLAKNLDFFVFKHIKDTLQIILKWKF